MTLIHPTADQIIGEAAHRQKWLAKLLAYGFDRNTADRVYRQAVDSWRDFGGFSAAVKAWAGCEDGIRTAPTPSAEPQWNA